MQTHVPAPAEQAAKQQNTHNTAQLAAEPQTQFEDARPEAAQLKARQALMGASPQQQNQLALQAKMKAGGHTEQAQMLQAKMAPSVVAQRMEEDEPLQAKFEGETAQREEASEAPKPNKTGLPNQLKAGIESLSGMSMDHVKVHYNSSQPAQLNAHAYAQGGDIHVAPGQEQHLPHEAWHVVQQAQGRVKPTMQMKGDVPVNDDAGLEHEADVMGARALQHGAVQLVEQGAATGSVFKEVEIDQLPDDQARKHLSDSFKKGKMQKPIINQTGDLIQRLPKKESVDGGDLFVVLKSDLNTGTATSKGTREYVNDPSTFQPESILFDYKTNSSTAKAKKEVNGNKMAYEVENPEADHAYKSGSLWDAGHKLGKQNGGLGNDNAWVFPQNPAFNQGNSRNMDDVEETNPLWRAYEDDFHEGVKADGGGVWWIKLV